MLFDDIPFIVLKRNIFTYQNQDWNDMQRLFFSVNFKVSTRCITPICILTSNLESFDSPDSRC